MDLNAFPDTVLRVVFDRIPLSDLVRHIPLVCHRWNSLQPSVILGKKTIALTILVRFERYRQSIEIFECDVTIPFAGELTNEDGSRMYPSPMDDARRALTLSLRTFTSETVDALIGNLGGNVTYLKMVFDKRPRNSRAIPLVIRLLDHWARGLKTLKFYRRFLSAWKTPEMARLIETINTKLPVLEHLTIRSDNNEITQPPDLPVLGRLKEFFFSTGFGCVDYLFPSLKRYAEPNDQLRAIGLGNSGFFKEFMDAFAESSLRDRFTILLNVGVPFSPIVLPADFREREHFISTFTEQTNIKVEMYRLGLNMVELTSSLAPLHNLVYLDLRLDRPMSKYDSDPVDQIRALPSVKVLQLELTTRSHNELTFSHFGRIFPNVQIIILYHIAHYCRLCGLDIHDSVLDLEKVASCEQQTLHIFKQQFGTSLKKVYYCLNDDHYNIKVYTQESTS